MNPEYMTTNGVIEFDPETKDVNGKSVTQFTMVVPGQQRVRVTIWPELTVPTGLLKLGLGVAVRGKYDTTNGTDGRTFHNISANTVGIGTEVYVKERTEIVQKAADAEAPSF